MSGTERMTVAEYRRANGLPPRACDLAEDAANAKAISAAVKDAERAQVEDELQRAVVKWLRYGLRDDVRFTHIPLGGKRRRVEAARFKGLGVEAGWPDLIFVWSDGYNMEWGGRPAGQILSRVAFMELKALSGSLTAKQREFQGWCSDNFIPHAVCRSLDEVVAAVRSWGIVNKSLSGAGGPADAEGGR